MLFPINHNYLYHNPFQSLRMNAQERFFALTISLFYLYIYFALFFIVHISFRWKVRLDRHPTHFQMYTNVLFRCNYITNSNWCILFNKHHRSRSVLCYIVYQLLLSICVQRCNFISIHLELERFKKIKCFSKWTTKKTTAFYRYFNARWRRNNSKKKSIINFPLLSMTLSNYQI